MARMTTLTIRLPKHLKQAAAKLGKTKGIGISRIAQKALLDFLKANGVKKTFSSPNEN